MFRRIILVSVYFALCLKGMASPKESGMYSKHAHQLWEKVAGNPKPVIIHSPDRKSSVAAQWLPSGGDANEEHVELTTAGKIGVLRFDIGPGVGSELLWAPDSSALFITTSNAGLNGDYHLYVIGTFDNKLQSRDITALIYENYGHPVRCDPNDALTEEPNVAGIGWLHDSRHLWVAAEVVAHTVCDSMGTFKAYEVDPSKMKVIRSLGQLQAKRELRPFLGQELKAADDSCIRNPKSCYIAYNHPELQPK